jgi:hypothetical protein
MNHRNLIFLTFSLVVGTLVFAIWSNTHVFAQHSPSLSSSSSLPSSSGSGSSSPSNPISSELKAKMCDSSNPTLKVVNTTEARICGIPKTVKPPLASSTATPPTSAVSSSSPSTQQTTTTKSTTVATNTATPPKQQQVKTSNNNTNAISSPTGGPTGTTIAPVSQLTTNVSSSPSAIAPQVKAVNQQPQQQQPLIRGINSTTGTNSTPAATIMSITPINGTTAGQNYTGINSAAGQNDAFLATPPVAPSAKLMYLGYHGADITPTNGDSSPNDKSSSDSKQLSIHRSSSSTTFDDDSTGKKKVSSIKLDRSDSANKDSSPKKDKSSSSRSSGSTNDGSELLSLIPDLESAIKNKVDYIIKNTISSINDNTPFLLPFP